MTYMRYVYCAMIRPLCHWTIEKQNVEESDFMFRTIEFQHVSIRSMMAATHNENHINGTSFSSIVRTESWHSQIYAYNRHTIEKQSGKK